MGKKFGVLSSFPIEFDLRAGLGCDIDTVAKVKIVVVSFSGGSIRSYAAFTNAAAAALRISYLRDDMRLAIDFDRAVIVLNQGPTPESRNRHLQPSRGHRIEKKIVAEMTNKLVMSLHLQTLTNLGELLDEPFMLHDLLVPRATHGTTTYHRSDC